MSNNNNTKKSNHQNLTGKKSNLKQEKKELFKNALKNETYLSTLNKKLFNKFKTIQSECKDDLELENILKNNPDVNEMMQAIQTQLFLESSKDEHRSNIMLNFKSLNVSFFTKILIILTLSTIASGKELEGAISVESLNLKDSKSKKKIQQEVKCFLHSNELNAIQSHASLENVFVENINDQDIVRGSSNLNEFGFDQHTAKCKDKTYQIKSKYGIPAIVNQEIFNLLKNELQYIPNEEIANIEIFQNEKGEKAVGVEVSPNYGKKEDLDKDANLVYKMAVLSIFLPDMTSKNNSVIVNGKLNIFDLDSLPKTIGIYKINKNLLNNDAFYKDFLTQFGIPVERVLNVASKLLYKIKQLNFKSKYPELFKKNIDLIEHRVKYIYSFFADQKEYQQMKDDVNNLASQKKIEQNTNAKYQYQMHLIENSLRLKQNTNNKEL